MSLTINDVRDVVREFAVAMEEQLRANDHKGGWSHDTPGDLLLRLDEEARELRAEVLGTCRECGTIRSHRKVVAHPDPDPLNVRKEAADVANFAMFVAERMGGLAKRWAPAHTPRVGGGGCDPTCAAAPPHHTADDLVIRFTASSEAVAAAKAEMARENAEARARDDTPERHQQVAENRRRSNLPSEHPEHICGMFCDGRDGSNSDCARLRRKLFR